MMYLENIFFKNKFFKIIFDFKVEQKVLKKKVFYYVIELEFETHVSLKIFYSSPANSPTSEFLWSVQFT